MVNVDTYTNIVFVGLVRVSSLDLVPCREGGGAGGRG